MHRDRHVGRNIRHRIVDELAVQRAELVRIVAALAHLLAVFRIAQHRDENFIKLQIAAAGIGKAAHRLLVGVAEIVPERIHRRIRLVADRRAGGAAVDRGRRGNGDLRRVFGVRGDELEMLDHRMRPGHAELAGDLHALVARGDGGERDAGVHHVLLGAIEAPEEIEMPPRAAEFAVGDRLQPDFLLLLDDALDLAVFYRLEFARRKSRPWRAWRAPRAAPWDAAGCRHGRPGTAEQCASRYPPHTSSAISTTNSSFAHCSSSARILPSSLEAKPHCGDRQS